jgi:nitrite reductase (NADH) large subunit
VALHTGLRAGSRLDFALLASFLALLALGAAAGAFTALEPALPARARGGLRRVATELHRWVFFPFLVLVSFHVFKVYWF